MKRQVSIEHIKIAFAMCYDFRFFLVIVYLFNFFFFVHYYVWLAPTATTQQYLPIQKSLYTCNRNNSRICNIRYRLYEIDPGDRFLI